MIGNTLIIGDSYSTFRGYIPDNYAAHYGPHDDMEHGGIGLVERTWWYQTIEQCGGTLHFNCSFSGSAVCYSGYEDMGRETSFVSRIRDTEGVLYQPEEVDTVLIFGGTNDTWAGAPMGEMKYENIVDEDLKYFYPAFSLLVDFCQKHMQKARIVVIINSDLTPEVTNGMAEIADHYGVEHILLHDIEKYNDHPTILGMTQLANQVSELLNNK